MNTRETLLRIAFILQAQDIPAQVCFHRHLAVRGDIAASLNADGRIAVLGVRDHTGAVILRAHTPKVQTPEDIARLVVQRQGIVDAEEARRRAALTPEQREREDRPVCAVCRLRDPLPGQERCRVCSEARAA